MPLTPVNPKFLFLSLQHIPKKGGWHYVFRVWSETHWDLAIP